MPTHDELPLFLREYRKLGQHQQTLFLAAVDEMVEDLKARVPFRASLRVKGVTDHPGIFEMTWEMPNGRATFSYGPEVVSGETHIIWRRIGGHEILNNP